MDETKVLLNAIIERLDVQGARMESIAHQVNHLTGEVAAIKSDIVVMKNDIEVMKSDIAVMKSDIEVMKSDIVAMKSDIEVMKGDISGIKVGQQRQDKILETLAVRSIEQETDIRELRRAN